jgi:3-(3-hydroxy-phenyl)propionate hydroxylase
VFTQPPVEEALRDHAASYGSVEVSLGTELLSLEQSGTGVTLDLRSDNGQTQTVTADYVIACDGASSGVREQLGVALEDLVFDEPWLVVDVLVNEEALSKLPQTAAQYCDPARPTTYIIGPGSHRRWEIMLLPDEDPREAQEPEQVWKLLSKWLSPDDATLWRAASYRFHALVAREWRRDRIFLAGDAAHQQPPFIGQGMCQGLRDVSNLIWKLDRVLKGQSGDAVLDTYQEERSEHVRQLTSRIKAIGKVICERDPEAARERDARILAEGGGQPRTITRQEIVPPLQKGLLAPQDNGAKGTLFPQPWVRTETGRKLLDAVVGAGWRLIIDGRHSPHTSRSISRKAEDLGLHVIKVGSSIDASSGADPNAHNAVIELDGVLARWFDAHRCHAAIARPDHYVFGTASDEESLSELMADLQARLRLTVAGSPYPNQPPVSLHARTAS